MDIAEGNGLSRENERDHNLDLIRAAAITMVLIYHGVVMSWLPAPSLIRQMASYGQYGVDLFFVLSGWLIGGLYWREQRQFGQVLIGRFWLRRWARTIPPYLVALLFYYLATHFARNEPFDFGYLAFFQNYYQHVPFFTVSWSLCVEEHFYLLLPLVFLMWRGISNYRLTIAFLLSILLTAPVLRFVQYPGSSVIFGESVGFAASATHLRMDGLILGVLLSYIVTESPHDFQTIVRKAPYVILFSVFSLPILELMGGQLRYTFWPTMVALLFASIMVFAVSCNKIGSNIARVVCPVALASYSTYLVHPLALQVARLASKGHGTASYLALAGLLIAGFAIAFFFVVERTAIAIRDLHCPRRKVKPLPQKSWSGMIRSAD